MSEFFAAKLKEIGMEGLPAVTPDIPHGDMPGDKISIDEGHVAKAKTILPELLKKMDELGKEKITLAVCGGSGVGKSEIASILGWYLKALGVGTYVLSGDNYPHRIPMYNDAERVKTFRESGIRGMVKEGTFRSEYYPVLKELQEKEADADPKQVAEYPWLASYQKFGREALKGYLGTLNEIDFPEVDGILKAFHDGAKEIWLRRLGRTDTELWYDGIDFSEKQVLILEWTHGNSDFLSEVDIPILLNSTPEETLAHRRARNRDGKTDSAFTTMVLEIEQGKLRDQAHKAKIIISKQGALMSFDEYETLMGK